MTDRLNTIAGWVLFSGIIALGLSILSGMFFQADKVHAPHEAGYPIEAAEEEGGAAEGPPLAVLLAGGDAAKGQAIFAKCQSCHTINAGGANGIGPNLFKTIDEPIGKGKAGFAFSDALASHGGNWTYENLDAWLASPKAFAPGTKMSFAGLSNPQERADLILYLRDNGGGPALPTPPAAAPAEGDTAGDPSAEAGPAEVPAADAAGAAAAPAPAAGAQATH